MTLPPLGHVDKTWLFRAAHSAVATSEGYLQSDGLLHDAHLQTERNAARRRIPRLCIENKSVLFTQQRLSTPKPQGGSDGL